MLKKKILGDRELRRDVTVENVLEEEMKDEQKRFYQLTMMIGKVLEYFF